MGRKGEKGRSSVFFKGSATAGGKWRLCEFVRSHSCLRLKPRLRVDGDSLAKCDRSAETDERQNDRRDESWSGTPFLQLQMM